MASIEVKDITSSSFYARVVGMDADEGLTKWVSWQLNGISYAIDSSDDIADTSSESNWILFNNLDQNTEYEIIASVVYLEGAYWEPDLTEYVTTLGDASGDEGEDPYIPNVESIYIQERDADDPATQIAVRAMGFDEKYPYDWEIYWYVYKNNSQVQGGTDTVDAGDDRSKTKTFSGLTPDTKYTISLRVKYKVDNSYKNHYAKDIYITTKSESSSSNRPDEFTWKDGTKEKQSGKPFDITAEEWGNLLNNINAVREYKEHPKIETTTTPNSGIEKFYYPKPNDTFYATNYNQCLYAFKTMGIITDAQNTKYTVEPKDPITADAINFLVKAINSVE